MNNLLYCRKLVELTLKYDLKFASCGERFAGNVNLKVSSICVAIIPVCSNIWISYKHVRLIQTLAFPNGMFAFLERAYVISGWSSCEGMPSMQLVAFPVSCRNMISRKTYCVFLNFK
jgi:hypothetical protein